MDALAPEFGEETEHAHKNEMAREHTKRSLASTFDRLIEANLALVVAVRGLVRVSYCLLALNTVVVLLILILILRR